jgi:hypothetical protein
MDHHAALAVSLLGALSLACGAEEERGLDEAGVSGAVDASTEDVLAELDALGYAGGTEVGEGEVGVLHHDPQRARQGLNFYVCGHAAEAVLMDMEGTELHRWQYGFHEAFPDAREEPNAEERGRHHWRRAYLLEDGSLIAIFDGQGLIRVGPDSLLRWANPLRAHHAAHVLESGELFVLSRENHVARVLGKEQPGPSMTRYPW